MNNQILKAACSLMLMRRTPIEGVRGVFLYNNSNTLLQEGMRLENLDLKAEEQLFVWDKGVVINPRFKRSTVFVHSGGQVNGGIIDGARNYYITVGAGGVISGLTAEMPSGYLAFDVQANGVMDSCVINGGSAIVHGVANDCILNWEYSVPHITVKNGGVANRSVIRSWQEIEAGGTSNYTHILSYHERVQAGGTSNHAIIYSDGRQEVRGISNYATVESGGQMRVYSGGQALNLFKKSGAVVTVDTGATVTYRSEE